MAIKNKIFKIAIGGFDGMHLAHQALFDELDENGAIVVIETGYANLSPKTYREQYTKYPIFYYPLEDIKHLDAIQFISLLKKEYPNLQTIIVGYDFHFGTNRRYSISDLQKLFDGDVIVVNEIKLNNLSVHSKIIRTFLTNGDIEEANNFLNKTYQITATPISGQGLGKKQFVPTINLQCDAFLLPSFGIYATKTIISPIEYHSITFIGHRLTTDGKFAIETHIISNFTDNNKISQNVQIKFFKKIRDNKYFDKYENLRHQILDDIDVVKNHFTDSFI